MPIVGANIPSVDNDMVPLGDVTLAPFALTGLSEAHLARALVAQAPASESGSDAAALQHARRAFANSPLAFRLGALAALIRRR
jgi:hypothetical protein